MTLDSIFNRWTNKLIEKGKLKGLWWPTIIAPQIFLYCITGIPCFLACYFGSQAVASVVNSLGATFLGVLSTVGGIMYCIPALAAANETALRAVIEAAEEKNSPLIILQMYCDDILGYGKIATELADKASVPVSIILDHVSLREIKEHPLRVGGHEALAVGRIHHEVT